MYILGLPIFLPFIAHHLNEAQARTVLFVSGNSAGVPQTPVRVLP